MLYRYACRLRGLGLTREEADALVLEAARQCRDDKGGGPGTAPFPEGKALEKVEQAWKHPGPDGIGSVPSRDSVVTESEPLPFRTAAQIAEETVEVVEWIMEPYVAKGVMTELDGKAKASGKTTLLMFMVGAVLDGKPFLGHATRKTPVVYLTEQPRASLRQALKRSGLLGRQDLHILRRQDVGEAKWPEVVRQTIAKCREVGACLLIVDTIAPFAGLQGDAENQSGAALEVIKPLHEATAGGIAVVLARHERKGPGDVGESGRGSSAFSGEVDIILSLRRPEGNGKKTVRVIYALSRFEETPDTMVIELTPDGYVPLGSEVELVTKAAARAILEIAPASVDKAIKRDELQETLQRSGFKKTTITKTIKQLVDEGDLLCLGKGGKADPHRFYKPPADIPVDKDGSITTQTLKRPNESEPQSAPEELEVAHV